MSDMTDAIATDPTDRRRAAALISHRAAANEIGARYIIDEARTAERMPQLLAAVIDIGGHLLDQLRTDIAAEAVLSMMETWSKVDDHIDYRLAATATLARPQGRHDDFNHAVTEAITAGQMAEVTNTAAQLFLTMMPELHSMKGRATLTQITAAMSGEEDPTVGN